MTSATNAVWSHTIIGTHTIFADVLQRNRAGGGGGLSGPIPKRSTAPPGRGEVGHLSKLSCRGGLNPRQRLVRTCG